MMDKKNYLWYGLLSILFLVSPFFTVIGEEPFAPKVNLPKNLDNREMWVNLVKSWKVPGKSEVGVPAYPGSVIVSLGQVTEMDSNGEKIKPFPSLILATSDEPAKVTAFYKENLNDWKYMNQFDMMDIFWTGRDKFNSMNMDEAMTTENIIIMKAISAQTDFFPEAKTAITIVYKPKQ